MSSNLSNYVREAEDEEPLGEEESDLTYEQKKQKIIEYLMKQPSGTALSVQEIFEDIGIDLRNDDYLVDLLTNDRKIERSIDDETEEICFSYQDNYRIADRDQLLAQIYTRRNGVLSLDIQGCYPTINADISDFKYAGIETMAAKSHEQGSGPAVGSAVMFYPRNTICSPYLVDLSGKLTVRMGESKATTTCDIQPEVRRGDALLIGSDYKNISRWFRINSNVLKDDERVQTGRSRTPLSVSSEKVMSFKDERQKRYVHEFTKTEIPFTREFVGPEKEFTAVAKKHGCTNDVRECWSSTDANLDRCISDAALDKVLRENSISTLPMQELTPGEFKSTETKQTAVKKRFFMKRFRR